MDKETDEVRLTDLEYRVLQILREDARTPGSKIAKQLGISRVTISRVVRSLKQKGVKFEARLNEEELVAVVTSDSCLSEECFKVITGEFVSIVRGHDLSEIEKKLEGARPLSVILGRTLGKRVVRESLRCDYCGGKIEGEPITYKLGRKTYYACCRACYEGLREKLQRRSAS
ncbi:MAG: TRASH domain-containing protein [Candidatus Aramenus sp.]|jgi:DNA-binding Lrp family transcriptional regulator|nr:TRASH domain-containing protein [Candidatus Aramenus sp.]